MILIISSRDDGHLPYVQRHLTVESRLIDPVRLVQGEPLDYAVRHGQTVVRHAGEVIDDVCAVWFRRPSPISAVGDALVHLRSEQRAYAQSAIHQHMLGLYHMFGDAVWVSDYMAIMRAEIKPVQLQRAARAGLRVPETLFATDAAEAAGFVLRNGECIAKPQSMVPAGSRVAFASRIRASDKLDFNGLRYDPYILQQYIEPRHEYRVTVVGDQLFTVTVRNSEEGEGGGRYRDWRSGWNDGHLIVETAELPPAVAASCRRLVRDYGLRYGAIDIIEDRSGKFWFLEINPNGQWAFVESATGLPIGQAIAGILQDGTLLV